MKGILYVGAAQPAAGPNTRGIYRRSASDGAWKRLEKGLPDDLQVNCIVARPDDPRSLYIGAQCGLFHSADGGDSWKDCGLDVGEKDIYSILLHPSDPATIYVGLDHSAIAKTTDGGKTWRYLPTVQPAGAITGCFPVRVLRLAANPKNPEELYAGMEVGGIIRSLDGGKTWEDISAPLIEMSKQPHLKSKILSDSETEGMMDLHALVAILWAASFLGDNTNYWVGRFIGPRVFRSTSSRLLNRKHLERTHQFYERHGGKTIVIARFMPIVRTFAPFVAGIGRMNYAQFVGFSAAGSVFWIGFFVYGGYLFGNLPFVKQNLTWFIIGIVLISVAPGLIAWIRARTLARAAVVQVSDQ